MYIFEDLWGHAATSTIIKIISQTHCYWLKMNKLI